MMYNNNYIYNLARIIVQLLIMQNITLMHNYNYITTNCIILNLLIIIPDLVNSVQQFNCQHTLLLKKFCRLAHI